MILVRQSGKVINEIDLSTGETAEILQAERVVVGLDPATKASGYAVLVTAGDRQWFLETGVYHAVGEDRLGKLASIYSWARDLVTTWGPDLCSIETVHHGPNAATTIKLAEVGAAIRLAVHHAGVAILDVSPAEHRAALSLAGNAPKWEVLNAINSLYGLGLTDDNEADAAALAVAGAAELKIEALGLAGLM